MKGQTADGLGEDELTELFARSHTMDFSHDAAADPESHGYGDPPVCPLAISKRCGSRDRSVRACPGKADS
jgi:hypothetical protein